MLLPVISQSQKVVQEPWKVCLVYLSTYNHVITVVYIRADYEKKIIVYMF